MASLDRFQVVLLPRREVLAYGLTLAEAGAYASGYQEVNDRGPQVAVIAREGQSLLASSARRLRQTSAKGARPSALLRSA